VSNLLQFPQSPGPQQRVEPIHAPARDPFERLLPEAQLSAYLVELAIGLGRLSETVDRINQLGGMLPDGPFKDNFEPVRLGSILRIREAKAEVERIVAMYLASLAAHND
jgi:hypothetical protein